MGGIAVLGLGVELSLGSLDAKAITDKEGSKAAAEASLEEGVLAQKDKNTELTEDRLRPRAGCWETGFRQPSLNIWIPYHKVDP